MIRFNKPYISGNELTYISEAIASHKLSGNGRFTQKCHAFFEEKYGFRKVLLTTSCTDALEMAAILMDIQPGDEVIMPSFTFVSTANAFVIHGARIVFADSEADSPNVDVSGIEPLINEKTKAIVVVHYAGIACQMDEIRELARKHDLLLIEDAAQAIDSYYRDQPLGSLGHLAAFSFHDTKNIVSGEGGMLVINDEKFIKRAEIVWEKGTNRAAFYRGEVDVYNWVDQGSSFLPSELNAAFLYAQLENLDDIQQKRIGIWKSYLQGLKPLADKGKIVIQNIPSYATVNGHIFYLLCRDIAERDALIAFLKAREITAVFHYISLHKSPFYLEQYEGPVLTHADHYSDRLLRLPLFYELTQAEIREIIAAIWQFYGE